MTGIGHGPPDHAMKLAAFIGDWKVEGSISDGESQSRVAGTWRFEKAIDGWGVLGRLSTDIDGVGGFAELEIIGFDSKTGKVHLISSNRFTIRDHIGTWIEHDKLKVAFRGFTEDSVITEEIRIEFVQPNLMTGRVIEQVDGTTVITTELRMERAG